MSRRRHVLQMIDDTAKVGIPIRKTFRSIKISYELLETFVQTRFNNPHQTARLLIVPVIEVPPEESTPKTTVRLLRVGLRHVARLKCREAHLVSFYAVVVVPCCDKAQLLVYRSFISVCPHLPNTIDGHAQQKLDLMSQTVVAERTNTGEPSHFSARPRKPSSTGSIRPIRLAHSTAWVKAKRGLKR